MFSIDNKIFIIPLVVYTIIIFFSGFYLGKYIYNDDTKVETSNVKYNEFWKNSNHWATKPVLITEFDTLVDTVKTEPIVVEVPVEVIKEQPNTRIWTGNVSQHDYSLNIGLWNTSSQQYEVFEYDSEPKFYFTNELGIGHPLYLNYKLAFNFNTSLSVDIGLYYFDRTQQIYPTLGVTYTF